jgi:adenylyltransferase/sulfurtransferase
MSVNNRYSRQILFPEIGQTGQDTLRASTALIVGCGALGSAQAESLARAGVGSLRIVDRDFVEPSNLQRQTMFTEKDAADRLPKAVACASHLGDINSEIQVDARVIDVNHSNVEELIDGCDVVLDGTDNFATRYLINDACVKHNANWIYGAAVGSYGVTMTIRPNQTPCLRCIFAEPPQAATTPTCDTAGVIMPIISMISAIQVTEALKLLTRQPDRLHQSLMQFDVWTNEWRRVKPGEPRLDCSTCGLRRFDTLAADASEFAVVLCGRHAVQISPSKATNVDLPALSRKLQAVGAVNSNDYLVRFNAGEYELTVFKDARSIIRGTDDIATARSIYAKYVGN